MLTDLGKLGLTRSAHAGVMVSGLLPISAIEDVARLESLRAIRPAYVITASAPTSSQGLVVSQGDALIGADIARADFGVDGSGVNIGIISDSFDCQDGYSTDVENGELPDDVNVFLENHNGFCDLPATDEGRAIAQVIHDVAPGAGLTFYSGFQAGKAEFVEAIDWLANNEQVDIIVSDYVHLTAPMFQDGLIAQAVSSAVASSSVVYIASAGNGGLSSFQADFDTGNGNDNFFPGLTFPGDPSFDPDSEPPIFFGGVAHDFDDGPDKDYFQ